MAKIAAIIAPTRMASRLAELRTRLCHSMCLYEHSRAETQTYRGQHAVCLLLRVAPDALNPQPQPLRVDCLAGVACGYYLAPVDGAGDAARGLLADLAHGGVAALPRGDGVFAFAYWHTARQRLTVGVDKLGMRPLYWAALPGGGYAIASELKALVGLMDGLDTNWAAWEEQLTFGFLFGEHTFFKGIQRLAPGQCITFRHDGYTSQIVEDFLDTIDVVERPMDSFLEEQEAIFDTTMARLAGLYNARDHTMLTLSGGYDSRRTLGWLLNQDIRPTAYTIPDVPEDGREFESAIVGELCAQTQLDGYAIYPPTVVDRMHVARIRDLATDFESDEHNFSTILAMGLNCHDKINYDGLAAGSQLSAAFVAREFFEPGGDARFLASRPRSANFWLDMPSPDAPPLEVRMREQLARWGDNPNRFAYFYLLSRTRREIALAPLSIQANVFESLCPYLDREMMRSALSFPPAHKLGGDIQMRLIEALNPCLAGIPTVYSRGIKADTRYRSHHGRIDRGACRATLKQVSRQRLTGKHWSFSRRQRLRFRAAGILAALGASPRIRWESGKASRIGQLIHFDAVCRSPEDYRAATTVLKSVWGQYTGWQKALRGHSG